MLHDEPSRKYIIREDDFARFKVVTKDVGVYYHDFVFRCANIINITETQDYNFDDDGWSFKTTIALDNGITIYSSHSLKVCIRIMTDNVKRGK